MRNTRRRRRAALAATAAAAVLALGLALVAVTQTGPTGEHGRVGPADRLLGNGRQLRPAGALVPLGNFPTGGRATPDARRSVLVDRVHRSGRQ